MTREIAVPLCCLVSAAQFYEFSGEEMETAIESVQTILLESANMHPYLPALENIQDPLDLLSVRWSVVKEMDTHKFDDPLIRNFHAWLLLRLRVRAVKPEQSVPVPPWRN